VKCLKFCVIVVGFLFLGAIAAAQGKETWTVLKPAGSVFSVNLPGTPKKQSQDLTDPETGKMVIDLYLLAVNGFFYTLEDMKADRMPSNTNKLLSDFESGFLRTSGMELVAGKNSTFKGYPSRNMVFKKDTKQVRGFAVIVGTRILAFFGGGEASKMNSPNIEKFFNSIKINGR
jgi:hypothetical protein